MTTCDFHKTKDLTNEMKRRDTKWWIAS